MSKKITKATFKSFLKKNEGNLFINIKRSFDGMIDGCRTLNEGFKPLEKDDHTMDSNLGYDGIWLVGGSRDYFTPYEDGEYEGITVSNCCGTFVVAKSKTTVKK